MGLNVTGTGHLLGAKPFATAGGFSWGMDLKPIAIGEARRYLSLYKNGDLNNEYSLTSDVASTTSNALSMYGSSSSFNKQAVSLAAIQAAVWQSIGGDVSTGNALTNWLSGIKATVPGGPVPIGINQTVYGGRDSDFLGSWNGDGAHIAAWVRVLSDTEWGYFQAGGNPRYLKGLARYYKCTALTAGQTVVPDEMGIEPLTIVGAVVSSTTDPNRATFMTGGPIGSRAYAVGSTIPPINLTTVFDFVSSPFTGTLRQLAAPSQPTLTSGAGAAAREIVLGSTAAYSAGDYFRIGTSSPPTCVLRVNASIGSVLVADDQTWASGAAVYRFGTTPLAFGSIISNVFGGIAASAGLRPQCFFRAACNANAALFADSDIFDITVANALPVILARPKPRKRRFVTSYARR